MTQRLNFTPHGLQAVRLPHSCGVFAALLCVLAAGCGHESAPIQGTREGPRNADTLRFAIHLSAGTIRLGMSEGDFASAAPRPAGARPHLATKMPEGYAMAGWTSSDGLEGVLGYFHEGKLIQANYTTARLKRNQVDALVADYVRRFGEPAMDKSPERIRRQFGSDEDACVLEIETFRNGGQTRFSATLTDTAEREPMNRALQALLKGAAK